MNKIERSIQELEDMAHHKSLKKQLSDAALVEALKALYQADRLVRDGICGICTYNPPSSCNGKPCCYCPAQTAVSREC